MMVVEIGPYEKASLILLRTLTPLHVGAGHAVGVVDLPIERDGLGLPTIPPSGIKGAMRERFRGDKLEHLLFGPRPESREALYAGSFTILDAYLVAMPARSLKGVWALVAASYTLRRLEERAHLMGAEEVVKDIGNALKRLSEGLVEVSKVGVISEEAKKKLAIDGKVILNEEYVLEPVVIGELKALTQYLFSWTEEWRFVVVHDDLFRQLVERSLLRRARVRLREETKTVETGGLWEEEDVPANTVFMTVFLYSRLRAPDGRIEKLEEKLRECAKRMRNDVDEVRKYIEGRLLKEGNYGFLILGGHETIGRGVVEIIKVITR
ncbi:MAG: type III-B CRISPR module RAMP protein Cmr4 [Thermoprotei archaeon]|nr:MAG: type III-B CRISPR module RAMP protein Cmr4 [Thermoprotei archaeon]